MSCEISGFVTTLPPQARRIFFLFQLALSSVYAPESYVTLNWKWSNWIHQSSQTYVLHGSKGALPERRADSGAARKGPKQCPCASTGRQSNARGFQDVTLVDMTRETGPTVSMGEMSNLR